MVKGHRKTKSDGSSGRCRDMCCQLQFRDPMPFFSILVVVYTTVVFASLHPSRCRFLCYGLNPSVVVHRTQPLPPLLFSLLHATKPQQLILTQTLALSDQNSSQPLPAPELRHSILVPALAPVDQTLSQPMRTLELQHSVPVPALAPVDRTLSQPLHATEQRQSVPVKATALANCDTMPPESSAKLPLVEAPIHVDESPEEAIRIRVTPTIGHSSSQTPCAPELQHSVDVPAIALADLHTSAVEQPPSHTLCAQEPQLFVLIPALALADSVALEGGQPSSNTVPAPEP